MPTASKKNTAVSTKVPTDDVVANTPIEKVLEAEPKGLNPEQAYMRHDQKRRELVNRYLKEPKFPITISPFYAPYLGNVVMISLQGIPMYIPANGQTYLLPESYAAEAIQAMAQIDSRQRKQNRLSNVKENHETSIGAIKF